MGTKTEVVTDGYEVQDIIKTALLNYLHRQGITEAVRVTDWDEDVYIHQLDVDFPTCAAYTTIRYEVAEGTDSNPNSRVKQIDGRFLGLIEEIRYQSVQITMTTED